MSPPRSPRRARAPAERRPALAPSADDGVGAFQKTVAAEAARDQGSERLAAGARDEPAITAIRIAAAMRADATFAHRVTGLGATEGRGARHD